jgi:hypothetical protein
MAVPGERITHAISYVSGEVHALYLFSQMLARLHPERMRVLTGLDEIEQSGLANIEGLPVMDAVIDGFQYVIDGIRKTLQSADLQC